MRLWLYAVLVVAALVYWGAALHFLLNGSGWLALIVWFVIFGLAIQLVTWLLDRAVQLVTSLHERLAARDVWRADQRP